MRQITEQQILALAPNASAVSNAKKISQKGGFVKLYCSQDDTFFMGECSGSGKSNYITSADFIHPEEPVFRCSCPSRQFPCKHSLALLYEMLAQKNFTPCEIPEDILSKRAKKEASAEKKEEKKKEPPKVNKAARTKKLKKQLEGLDMTQQVVSQLLHAGLGTLGGNSLKVYQDLAKQLGDYYLPGPQLYIKRLIQEIELLQEQEGQENQRGYQPAVTLLVQLHALVHKARAYLKEKIESEQVGDDDSILYEELGGVWKLDQLQALGLKKENARLAQLSFHVYRDQPRGEFVDLGYWADVDTGEISLTYNYRPFTALKYVKAEDTNFELIKTPLLTYYPGGFNRRIRWEGAEYTPITEEHMALLREKASPDIASAVKQAKNQIKNILEDNHVAMTLSFHRIGTSEQGYVLEDHTGATILLEDQLDREGTVNRLSLLPDPSLLEDQVIFGDFYYDSAKRRICLQPYSILTSKSILRLQY